MGPWVGVDVGGRAKGFDVALVDERRLIELHRRLGRDAVVELVERTRPSVVAIDSPRSFAARNETTRPGERELARAVCGIRWTPDKEHVRSNPYYAWVVEGHALYEALAPLPAETIEVFPTASWTRWYGPRDGRRRSEWSRAALDELGLDGVPPRTSQDARDAIAAAVTAREYSLRPTDRYGEIVVPRATDVAWERETLRTVRRALEGLTRLDGTVIHSVTLEGTRPDASITVSWTQRPGERPHTKRYSIYGHPGGGSPRGLADEIWLEVMES